MAGLEILLLGALVLILMPIVITDLNEQRIPNVWNLVLGLVGFVGTVVRTPTWGKAGLAILAAVLTAAMFLGLIWIMKLLKRRGTLGLGDVKFLIAASLWVGFTGSAWVFVLASVFALLWSLAAAPWRGLDLARPLAFGPALAAGLVCVFAASVVFS